MLPAIVSESIISKKAMVGEKKWVGKIQVSTLDKKGITCSHPYFFLILTRMHSSRMRTAHLLTVSRSACGVSAQGGVCCVSQHSFGQTPPLPPPNRMTDRRL